MESEPTEDKSQHSSSALKGPAQTRTYLGLERQHHAVWETYGEAQLPLMWWKCHVSWCWQTAVKAEPQRRLIQISAAVTALFLRVTFCGVFRPHHLHLFPDLSSDESIPGVEASSGAQSVLTGQQAELDRVSSLLFFLFPPCMLCIHLPLPASLGLSCGVEPNRGRVTLTDWLMGGFCQLCLNKHKPFWARNLAGSLDFSFFFCFCFHPPHKLPHRWYAVHSRKIKFYCLRCGC